MYRITMGIFRKKSERSQVKHWHLDRHYIFVRDDSHNLQYRDYSVDQMINQEVHSTDSSGVLVHDSQEQDYLMSLLSTNTSLDNCYNQKHTSFPVDLQQLHDAYFYQIRIANVRDLRRYNTGD